MCLQAQLTDSILKSKAVREIEILGINTKKVRSAVKKNIHDSLTSVKTIEQLVEIGLKKLQSLGYISAGIDSSNSFFKDGVLRLYYQTGAYFYLKAIQLRNLKPAEKELLHLESLIRKKSPLNWKLIYSRFEKVLSLYQNIGYPFARFERETITAATSLTGDSIGMEVNYRFDPGELVRVDSVQIKGNIRERNRFVEELIKIKTGSVFNYDAIANIPQILNNTPYYQGVKSPKVIFLTKLARVIVEIEKRKANRFDGLIGLLPPQSAGQKFQFTALLDLQLVSALRWGEILNLHFEQLPNQSQKLQLLVKQPFIPTIPLSAELNFQLQKQDSSWLNRKVRLQSGWKFSAHLLLSAFWQQEATTLLNTAPYRQIRWPPPPYINANSQIYGLQFTFNNLNDVGNPTKGIELQIESGIGKKITKRPLGLDSLDFSRIKANQQRIESRLLVNFYHKIASRQVIKLGINSYWLSLSEYFTSDLKFYGGARSLRGFNENQFLVNQAVIGTLEYRLLLDQNSYAGLFVDGGWLNSPAQPEINRQNYQPIGLGITLAFLTQAGLLNVSYGVGKVGEQAFQFTRGRIHLGLVSQF